MIINYASINSFISQTIVFLISLFFIVSAIIFIFILIIAALF